MLITQRLFIQHPLCSLNECISLPHVWGRGKQSPPPTPSTLSPATTSPANIVLWKAYYQSSPAAYPSPLQGRFWPEQTWMASLLWKMRGAKSATITHFLPQTIERLGGDDSEQSEKPPASTHAGVNTLLRTFAWHYSSHRCDGRCSVRPSLNRGDGRLYFYCLWK